MTYQSILMRATVLGSYSLVLLSTEIISW